MLVSTKGRYALRVMIDLAQHNDGINIKLQDIAGRQLISEKYLESIMVLLSKAHLVDAVRGIGGGYKLNRSLDQYNVDEILELTEASMAPVACVQATAECNKRADCLTLPMWTSLDHLIHGYLGKITLQNLLDQDVPLE